MLWIVVSPVVMLTTMPTGVIATAMPVMMAAGYASHELFQEYPIFISLNIGWDNPQGAKLSWRQTCLAPSGS